MEGAQPCSLHFKRGDTTQAIHDIAKPKGDIMIYTAYAVFYSFAFLFGICIGSFLNVLIYRIPQGINIAKGRSFCPGCRNTIPPQDLIPVVSFLLLKRKCRFCGSSISSRYPVVELIGGVLAVISVISFWYTWQALLLFGISCILVTVAFIDWDTMEIPDSLQVAILLATVIYLIFYMEGSIWLHIIGFLIISLPMFLMNFIIQDSFGGGDIKLCAVCGLLLGWQLMLIAAFIALLTGGAYGIYLMTAKKQSRKTHFAFGPFLSLGIVITIYWGQWILEGYLSFL